MSYRPVMLVGFSWPNRLESDHTFYMFTSIFYPAVCRRSSSNVRQGHANNLLSDRICHSVWLDLLYPSTLHKTGLRNTRLSFHAPEWNSFQWCMTDSTSLFDHADSWACEIHFFCRLCLENNQLLHIVGYLVNIHNTCIVVMIAVSR